MSRLNEYLSANVGGELPGHTLIRFAEEFARRKRFSADEREEWAEWLRELGLKLINHHAED